MTSLKKLAATNLILDAMGYKLRMRGTNANLKTGSTLTYLLHNTLQRTPPGMQDRQPALMLVRRRDLPEMCDNSEIVSQVPPPPMSPGIALRNRKVRSCSGFTECLRPRLEVLQ